MESIPHRVRRLVALVCVALLAHGESALFAQEATGAPAAQAAETEPPSVIERVAPRKQVDEPKRAEDRSRAERTRPAAGQSPQPPPSMGNVWPPSIDRWNELLAIITTTVSAYTTMLGAER